MTSVSGGRVWVEDSGGTAPAVVLLHPGWGDLRIWDPVVEGLARSARVIRYDMRGYRQSPPAQAPYTQLGDVVAVLDKLAVASAVVVGHSGGGATAISLALEAPGRVGALLLLAPGVTGYPWPEDDPYFAEFAELLTAGDRHGMVGLGMRTWAPNGGDAAREQIRSAVNAFFTDGEYEEPDPPAFDRLSHVTAPTTVVIGGRDHPMVTSCADAITERIGDGNRLTIPEADHMLPLRNPADIVQCIGGYLR